MHFANLSNKLLKKYLDQTVTMGYIRPSNDDYEVTEKGQAFLEKYDLFCKKYSKVKKKLEAMRFDQELLEKMCQPKVYTKTRSKSDRMRLHRNT